MIQILKSVVYAVIVLTALTAAVILSMGVHEVRYDCRLSEISPDFPPEVRQQCRNMFRSI
jgi:hypothetical protein